MTKNSLLPVIDPLDTRLNACRADLADMRLRGRVQADRFVRGRGGIISIAVANLKTAPEPAGQTSHQLLLGEPVLVFEQNEDWVWVQSRRDGYVGYLECRSVEVFVSERAQKTPTHVVSVPSTFLYPQPELKLPPVASLSMGSQIFVQSHENVRGTKYAVLADGSALIASHLSKNGEHDVDYVTFCELLEGVPYLWGGASGFGLDCAGLVQLAMRMSGREVLRDSDMQAATLGQEIDAGSAMQNLRRGDLIFWCGHVAVCQGDITGLAHIVHASGHTMSVASEPLHEAIERIAYLYQRPLGCRSVRGGKKP